MVDIYAENPVRWVSIDPGIGGTGLAFWENDRLLVGDWTGARGVYTIRSPQNHNNNKHVKSMTEEDWLEKALWICVEAEGLFDSYQPTKIVIEQPFISLSGKKTLVAASTNSVVKLSMIVGMLIWVARSIAEFHHLDRFFQVETVLPSRWKGQLPDKALKKRIEAWARKTKTKLPFRLSDHARDALGLGLSVLKEL